MIRIVLSKIVHQITYIHSRCSFLSVCLDNSSVRTFVYDLWPLFPMKNFYIYISKITEKPTVLNCKSSTALTCFPRVLNLWSLPLQMKFKFHLVELKYFEHVNIHHVPSNTIAFGSNWINFYSTKSLLVENKH